MNPLRSFALAALLALAAMPALAQQFKAGEIVVEQPWTRATPKGAEVAAGYSVIHNDGAGADKLIGGSAEFAGSVEIHQMTMEGGVMRMRQVDGIEIPPKQAVALKPNGYHLMFHGLKQQLVAGQTLKATLNFERAGAVAVEFKVGGIGAMKPAGGDSMGGMKME
jgi:copper(I)-binding protein